MTRLLDVNCLIALFDSKHVNHEAAHAWFALGAVDDWASCPITENGFLRVLANPVYPTVRASLAQIMKRLGEFCAQPGHVFWPDDVSLLKALDREDQKKLTSCAQITDFYLACLAAAHGGKLASFDGSLGKSLAGTKIEGSIEVLR